MGGARWLQLIIRNTCEISVPSVRLRGTLDRLQTSDRLYEWGEIVLRHTSMRDGILIDADIVPNKGKAIDNQGDRHQCL
jgi:hypothetical protein